MNCYTDKSMYAPGETICLRAVEMPPQTQWLRLTVFHLEQTVLTQTLPAQEEISLSLPEQDGAGTVREALDARQNVLACADMAVDVSSSWTKFPCVAMCGILRRLPMRRARSLRWRAIISTACSFTIGSIAIISRWPMICPPGRIGRQDLFRWRYCARLSGGRPRARHGLHGVQHDLRRQPDLSDRRLGRKPGVAAGEAGGRILPAIWTPSAARWACCNTVTRSMQNGKNTSSPRKTRRLKPLPLTAGMAIPSAKRPDASCGRRPAGL